MGHNLLSAGWRGTLRIGAEFGSELSALCRLLLLVQSSSSSSYGDNDDDDDDELPPRLPQAIDALS